MKDTLGIILAGGKGSRMGLKDRSKVTLELEPGKSILQKGVDAIKEISQKQIIVVGHHKESIYKDLENYDVEYAIQEEPNGTGHAAQVAVKKMQDLNLEAKNVIIGYGDHMYKYTGDSLAEFVKVHETENANLTILTAIHEDPNFLAWGRIVKDENGKFQKIVEQKDASEKELEITELNAGLYCFSREFLENEIFNLSDENVQKEYLLTDMVEIAVNKGLTVATYVLPFEEIGTGMNTPEHYEAEKGK